MKIIITHKQICFEWLDERCEETNAIEENEKGQKKNSLFGAFSPQQYQERLSENSFGWRISKHVYNGS